MLHFIPSTEDKTQENDGEVDSPGSVLSSNILLFTKNVCTIIINIIF